MDSASPRADLLAYYLSEITALHEEAAAFAVEHPQVAGALELSGDGSADPHVERLLQAFAFLTGRVQLNLDRQLPRIASAVLEALYPHLTAPVPTVLIAECSVDPKRALAASGFVLPRGTQLVIDTDIGAVCRFRTTANLTLWPIRVWDADRPSPALFPFLDGRSDVGGILRVRLEAMGAESFASVRPGELRFRIAGPLVTATVLYETLRCGVSEIWALDPATADGSALPRAAFHSGSARPLRKARIAATGFTPEESVIPHPARSHQGHRLLQEYFVAPEKFLFVDVQGLDEAKLADQRWLDLVLVLDRAAPSPVADGAPALRLGGVPAINLFPRISEPVRIDHTRTSYLVQPDARFERSTEIHSLRKVTLSSREDRDGTALAPFFSLSQQEAMTDNGVYWIARRLPTRRPDMGGTDTALSFRSREFDVARPPSEVAFAHVLCTNRGLAERVPIGAHLGLEVDAPVETVICATRPTGQVPAPVVGADLWRVVSHLALNQLSFADGPEALQTFRDHLRLYSRSDERAVQHQINGIVDIAAEPAARRIGRDAWRGFCRGMALTVTLDESHFIGGSGYLFGEVLSRFFGIYAGVNSFTELTLHGLGRDKEWAQWPPRAGDRILV